MEDALVPRTPNFSRVKPLVLILVLMEDALVHKKKSGRRSKSRKVLILVLMEDALVRETHRNGVS